MITDRNFNVKQVIALQNTITSRISETLNELLRDKNDSGKDDIIKMFESIKYYLDEQERFLK